MTNSLTDVLLREVSLERSDAIVFELGADATIQVPQSADIVAHFVIDGEISVECDKLERPATIRRGEYALLLYGDGHRILTANHDPRPCHDYVVGKWPIGDEPPVLTLGRKPREAKFISASLRTIYNPVSVQSQHPLSELLHFEDDVSRPLFCDAALLTDTAQIDAACRGPGASAFINSLMNLHFFHAFRCGFHKIKEALPLLPSPVDLVRSPSIRPIAVAVRLLRMHPERRWTVADLAQELGQSRSSFAANFKACVGIGPMEYLNNVRMERATELLQTRRDLSLCTIARRIGYDNVSSFARAFKAHFQLPPKTFSEMVAANEAIGASVAGA